MFKPNAKRKFGASKFSNSFSAKNRFSTSNSFYGKNKFNRKNNRSEQIDVSKFIKKPVANNTQTVVIKNKFSDFALCEALQNNLKYRNYEIPTPIQDQAIDHIISGRDLIGIANTGTGKTAAFLLPLIDKIFNDKSQKVLIMAPTRELAQQIEEELRKFSFNMRIFFAVCVGGQPIYKQIANLKRNPNFVIGTPGRLKDLVKRRLIRFNEFNNIVLDEVDRMLDMGFIDEITEVLNQLPQNRQSLFFSATMPQKIRDLTAKFLNSPITVEIKSGETAQNVAQDVVRYDKTLKFTKLQQILAQEGLSKVLIFAETKKEVEQLTTDLFDNGFKAESIHGDKRQSQRMRALKLFKDNLINILVATDVAARGLDIKDVTHVINYTIPQTYNDYIHRIGRTGRGSASGMALTFVAN